MSIDLGWVGWGVGWGVGRAWEGQGGGCTRGSREAAWLSPLSACEHRPGKGEVGDGEGMGGPGGGGVPGRVQGSYPRVNVSIDLGWVWREGRGIGRRGERRAREGEKGEREWDTVAVFVCWR